MKKEFFESDRYFTLFDVSPTHGRLLLRSQKSETDLCNIDIIFFGITFIQISNKFNGISIRLVKDYDLFPYADFKKRLGGEANILFEITSEDEVYYIVAAFARIFENNLEFHETSVSFDYTGKDKEIATTLQ